VSGGDDPNNATDHFAQVAWKAVWGLGRWTGLVVVSACPCWSGRHAAALKAAIEDRFPNLGIGVALDIGSKVAKCEMKWG